MSISHNCPCPIFMQGYNKQIGDAIAILAQGSWPCIEELELANTGMTAQGAAAIAAAAGHFPKLTFIDFRLNALGNAGAIEIAAATWPLLERLGLRDTGVLDEGAKALAAAGRSGRFPSLKVLCLGMNNDICPDIEHILREGFGGKITISIPQ